MQRDDRGAGPERGGLPGHVLAGGYVLAAAAPLMTALLSGIDPASPWREAGTGFGLVALAALFLQFLSSGRYESLSARIGIDRTMGFHRIAAVGLVLLAILHPLAYVGHGGIGNPGAAARHLVNIMTSPRVFTGSLALVLLVSLVLLALYRERLGWSYEMWRGTHGLGAVAAAALGLNHAMSVGTYSSTGPGRAVLAALAAIAAACLAIVYVVRPVRMWREHWQIEANAPVTGHIRELLLLGPERTALRFKAGQFIWITIAPHRLSLFDHPFSVASAPSELPHLRLWIRASGDATSRIGTFRPGTRVGIEGPHGSFVLPLHGKRIVLVAGGVGIAPVSSILRAAADAGDPRQFRVLHAARDADCLSLSLDLRKLAGGLDLEVDVLAGATGTQSVDRHLTPEDVRDRIVGFAPQDVVVMICGPGPMMEIAADAALASGVPETNIIYERFDYGAGHGKLDRRRRNAAALAVAGLFVLALAFALR